MELFLEPATFFGTSMLRIVSLNLPRFWVSLRMFLWSADIFKQQRGTSRRKRTKDSSRSSLPHFYTHTFSLSLSLVFTLTHSHIFSFTLSRSISFVLTFTNTFSRSLSFSHTHLFPIFPSSLPLSSCSYIHSLFIFPLSLSR